jgi:LCP family protein required for cell wall assembly
MRFKYVVKLLVILTVFVSSCNAPIAGLGRTPDGDAQDPDNVSGGTPTPFGPLQPTASVPSDQDPSDSQPGDSDPTPAAGDPWGDFAAPTRESAIEISPPVPRLNLSPDVVNFILLGSDEAEHRYGHRTDTIVLVSVNRDTQETIVISIPRDLFVYIPGWRVDRINTADLFGGWEMVSQTILYNFGIELDFWAEVNFRGFETAVNLLGGIEVEVTKSLFDECGGVDYAYTPGTYYMDGFTALCYVRMRKTTSDFDRLRRQQEVMQAVFRRVLTLDGLTRIPQLYGEFKDHYDGNIGIGDVLPLVPLASDIASGDASVQKFSIDQTMVTPFRVPSTGAAVLLPNREIILELFHDLFET